MSFPCVCKAKRLKKGLQWQPHQKKWWEFVYASAKAVQKLRSDVKKQPYCCFRVTFARSRPPYSVLNAQIPKRMDVFALRKQAPSQQKK